MVRRSILLVVAIVGLTFFVSCTPRGSGPNYGHPGNESTPTPQTGTPTGTGAQGTADSGGGNTFQGKPLESYKVTIRDLEAYRKIVATIVESEQVKKTRIGHAIKTILDDKIWYLIPSELKQLSADKIGSAVGSEQAALQDFKQVWINSLIFDKMQTSEQATLIVHEIMMGLKLLKLDTSQAECLAYQTDTETKDVQSCYNQGTDKVRGKPSDLTQSDYAQIRNATALAMEKGAQLSFSGWEELLGSQEIIKLPSKKMISLKELAQMIESSKIMKTWPTFGFDLGKFYFENIDILRSHPEKLNGSSLSHDQTCDFDFKISDDQFTFILNENGKTSTYSTTWTAPIQMNLVKDAFSSFFSYTVGTPTLKTSSQAIKGDEVAFAELKFVGQLLLGLEVRKTACLDENCSTSGQGLQGYFLFCHTKPNIRFNLPK